MKLIYDGKHKELQAYRQQSVSRRTQKLSARYCGPYKVVQRIGGVAYKMNLPPESKIHHVFHVSLLKKYVGRKEVMCSQLPVEGSEITFPSAILGSRARRGKKEVLVHWKGCSPAEATWEALDDICQQFLDFCP
ncbi:uncharacterized protein LOC142166807 [Nicotiana tabacum]|uniref:Uncharacterized protein LOC142166807 n=1 Tax=Nicotiana tabacum TaxID=4097 RepID=A0AC58SBG5_TOBAC